MICSDSWEAVSQPEGCGDGFRREQVIVIKRSTEEAENMLAEVHE